TRRYPDVPNHASWAEPRRNFLNALCGRKRRSAEPFLAHAQTAVSGALVRSTAHSSRVDSCCSLFLKNHTVADFHSRHFSGRDLVRLPRGIFRGNGLDRLRISENAPSAKRSRPCNPLGPFL